MKMILLLPLICSALVAGGAVAQAPPLPEGALTRWVVDQPHEVVGYVVFDPTTVERRLPRTLRFITLKELATGGVSWARNYLVEHAARNNWGISFLEIVQMGTFTIDGRAPNWPEHGAAALWFARVAPSTPATDLGPGRPSLALDFWMPDRAYVAYMRGKGYYATYGDVKLLQKPDSSWWGSVDIEGLKIVAECLPTGPVAGGSGAAGTQAIFPPHLSSVKNVVRVAFAGHREQDCGGDSSWSIHGTHPLAHGVVLPPSVFEFGYKLVGGTYVR